METTPETEEDDLIETADGEFVPEDETWTCEKTGEIYSNKVESVTVYVNRRETEEWCPEAVNDNAFFCSRKEEYYDSGFFDEIDVEGETVCREANDYDIYYWESDDEYHWEPEPEPEDEDEYNIPDYHDEDRPWERKDFGKELVFGCELELKANSDRAEIRQIANKFNLIGERDGSLCDTYGIEIIGPPLKLEEYSQNSDWMKFLEEVNGEAKGWDAGRGYGMHVSINRRALSDFHTGKLLVFINSCQELCEKIAGRGQTDYQVYTNKRIANGKDYCGDKYEALSLRGRDRLECRIFRSTLKPESFLKNIEFVAAAIEFTRFASCNKLHSENFKNWLKKNTSSYKNLARSLGILKTNPKKEEKEES